MYMDGGMIKHVEGCCAIDGLVRNKPGASTKYGENIWSMIVVEKVAFAVCFGGFAVAWCITSCYWF